MTEPATHRPTGVQPAHGPAPATPRWVRVFGTIVVILLAAFVILHLTGNGMGGHG